MDNENYISPNKITKQYDITSGTLRRWAEAGKIRCLRPNGGKRIYNIEDIKKIFNKENDKHENNKDENNEEKKNDNDIQNILSKLKENIQNNDSINSFDFITNELSVITELINHMKENENKN
jgi:DNA-binding transcriptional MerR regulator